MTATAGQVVAVASREIGVMESPRGSNRQKYGAWYGMNGVAWCAEFVSYVFAHTPGGASLVPKFAYCPNGEAWFRDRGQWHSTPKVGDLAFLDHAGVAGHVAIVSKVYPDGSYQTVEGNSNDDGSYSGIGVFSLHRPRGGRTRGFGRPRYAVPKPVHRGNLTRVLKLGMRGEDVRALRSVLKLPTTGPGGNSFGPVTMNRLYRKRLALGLSGKPRVADAAFAHKIGWTLNGK